MNQLSFEKFRGSILIIDDTLNNLSLLERILSKKGYEVRLASSGQRGLEAVELTQPDLILLDIMMPGIDGYEVCSRLKASDRTRGIPIIFLSALVEVSHKVKAFNIGGVDYIIKPFEAVEVLARVENQLRLRELELQLTHKNQMLQREIASREEAEIETRLLLETTKFQKEEIEELLLNILPKPIADRLQEGQSIIADSFSDVSVLFADLVGFTNFASQKSAAETVKVLNQIFSQFDRLSLEHGLEKIKTIGDAYMVVGGLPQPQENHAEAIAQMALDMQAALASFNLKHNQTFSLRIGINIGGVVAGVIGLTKFSYDLWGDTVNVAHRMESNGIPGEIQVTAAVYERLKDNFSFKMRGAVEIKGKGEMMTYLLLGRK
ncbi:MAG: response regulator [Microcoleus sp. PH2017_29_MFU_D_A]|jgi:adenylate cyclase|uniref:adenylate/guanylate cyclase domain-containing protein n=1 Tax=unclassified Microcoleus TaxID=2642155 RepID=UPI001D619944|nr:MULTISPECIES: adenylate/guanylate cyclase domain-containing protein [unclassified Microcoleus]MCC3421561.1 response regulator [Microcoleus sp. PH2017_07_MST_O_A]MCC3430371.1 response regulator [Microcoleus sp. PH2017_04_SCI_O_A]MCC3440812.1 response regulator [Microcoleus sp. PH2017_03_ELD_O_A]MCC3464970.1 response regulator [Microcoleus sp. PH2017_06_SFM_O_A]MCC3504434.1 response regulator [Microcoleus sp. PH2017_19_SFW_U_A]MCC3509575.1 response regulator [Microcoleus sp. PH2017_17_BER_D_